jgi:hypothetical protein
MNEIKKNLIAAAFAHVYTDVERFIRDQAKEHTIANLGQTLEDHVHPGLSARPEQIIANAFSSLMSDFSCEDETGDSVEDEMRVWLGQAKRDTALIQKKGLPLTMENARLAFERKGPFAKK